MASKDIDKSVLNFEKPSLLHPDNDDALAVASR
jgi:hypothetical protein